MTKAILGALLAIAVPVLAEAQSITVERATPGRSRAPPALRHECPPEYGVGREDPRLPQGDRDHALPLPGLRGFRLHVGLGRERRHGARRQAHDLQARAARQGDRPGARCWGGDLLHHEDPRLHAGGGGPLGGRSEETWRRGRILVPGQRALLSRRHLLHPPQSLRRSREPLRARHEGGRPGDPRRDVDGRALYRRAGRQGARQLRGPRREAAHRLR